MANHVLKGSERQPVKGARSLGKADPAERLEVTVLLRHRAADVLRDRVKEVHRASGRSEHIKREDFAQQFGADPSDIQEVEKFASSHGLTVVQESPARRSVVLAGTVARLDDAGGGSLSSGAGCGGRGRLVAGIGRSGAAGPVITSKSPRELFH